MPSSPSRWTRLRKIFLGEITNWKDVGGTPGNIVLYGRENSSGTYAYFKEHVLANKDFPPKYQALPGTGAVVDAVAKDKAALDMAGSVMPPTSRPYRYHEGRGKCRHRAQHGECSERHLPDQPATLLVYGGPPEGAVKAFPGLGLGSGRTKSRFRKWLLSA